MQAFSITVCYAPTLGWLVSSVAWLVSKMWWSICLLTAAAGSLADTVCCRCCLFAVGSFPAGFFPTLLEDVPDMAVKFAAYESMRQLHKSLNNGKSASPQVRAGSAAAQAWVFIKNSALL